jgi:hypothetical protein
MKSNQTFYFKVTNNFIEVERDLNVHHHSANKDHVIKNGEEPKTFHLQPTPAGGKRDHLIISVDHSHGELPSCKVELFSSQVELTFMPAKEIDLRISHLQDKTILRIPGKAPKWELKVTAPEEFDPVSIESQNVTLAEDDPGRPD